MNQQRSLGAGRLCVVLACFAGRKTAGRARGTFGKAMRERQVKVLDEVVIAVNAKRKASVHDPHRVVAGTLTSALTWGAFGLVASGASGLVVWAVLGAICGGGYAYLNEHVLTKRELQRIGQQLPPSSSALLAYLETGDDGLVLAHASKDAATCSAVVISPDLTASGVPAGDGGRKEATLTMELVRFAGEHAARKAATSPTLRVAQVELIFEVPPHGRPRVVSPTAGVAAMSKSDIVSWGAFGVAFGLIVGFAGDGSYGIFGEGVVKGVAWGLFGLVAGALYGLWVGRATSARRLKGLRALLPADTSTALIWFEGSGPAPTPPAAAARLDLHFQPTGTGAVLQAGAVTAASRPEE
jgi:hypothetical protein